MMKKVFTTGQVAKTCKVAPRTVAKWFDSGRLAGYRLAGSQDRRIPREHLIQFLKENGMPLGEFEDETMGSILFVAPESEIRSLTSLEDFRIKFASNGFEAGIQAESLHPDCTVIDFAIGQSEAMQICKGLRSGRHNQTVVLVALISDDDNAVTFDHNIFDETFRKPYDDALLVSRIKTLVGRKKDTA